MFDTHIHTEISTDSDMKLEEAVKKANEKNLGLIITEHMDTNHPEGKFMFDEEEYFEKYGKFRSNRLLLGIELGLSKEFSAKNFQTAKDYSFDYVLGSIHFLGNYDIYYPDVYLGKLKRKVYLEYLETMYESIKCHDFIDSLGHIDYICRYSPFEDKELYYDEFKNEIDDILKLLIEKDIVMELNTRRLSETKAAVVLVEIYKQYSALGGKYVTIGSDAHNAGAIGMNFDAALEICEKCSLKPVYFKNREMSYCKRDM